jgi:hypothetical protein
MRSVADLHAGAHDSVTDARVALALYRKHAKQWEQMLKRRDSNHHGGGGGGDDDEKKAAAEQSEPAKKGGKHASRSARADADADADAPVENEFSQLLKRL